MAINLTLTEFAAAIRAGDGVSEPTGPERIAIEATFRAVRIVVTKIAPNAPAVVANEALVRAGGYLYDAPEGQGDNFLVRSGASTLLKPWRVRRLAGVDDGDSEGVAFVSRSFVGYSFQSMMADFADVTQGELSVGMQNIETVLDLEGVAGEGFLMRIPGTALTGSLYTYFVYPIEFPALKVLQPSTIPVSILNDLDLGFMLATETDVYRIYKTSYPLYYVSTEQFFVLTFDDG